MKRWTLGKAASHPCLLHGSGAGGAVFDFVRVSDLASSRTLPRPAVRLPTCLSKAISLSGSKPCSLCISNKETVVPAGAVINTSILDLLLILWLSWIFFFLACFWPLGGSLFILMELRNLLWTDLAVDRTHNLTGRGFSVFPFISGLQVSEADCLWLPH